MEVQAATMRLWRKTSFYLLGTSANLLRAGLPQVVIPLWADHYGFAQLVESLGLGIYATRGTAPNWTVDGLAGPFLKILDHSDAGAKIRKEAARIGHIARKDPGRYVAARRVYEVIASEPQGKNPGVIEDF